MRIASDAGAVAGLVGHVVDGLAPDVAGGAVVAHQEGLEVVGEAAVLKLSPAATGTKAFTQCRAVIVVSAVSPDVRRVLPDHLGVVADPLTALLARTGNKARVLDRTRSHFKLAPLLTRNPGRPPGRRRESARTSGPPACGRQTPRVDRARCRGPRSVRRPASY